MCEAKHTKVTADAKRAMASTIRQPNSPQGTSRGSLLVFFSLVDILLLARSFGVSLGLPVFFSSPVRSRAESFGYGALKMWLALLLASL